jgi:serine/threonine protein kinase
MSFAERLEHAGSIVHRDLKPANVMLTRTAFDDRFFTQDVRLSRTFLLGPEGIRLSVIGEVFNLFNTANLVGNIRNQGTFGQPNARFTQVFGSGGPRAFQLGGRVSF